MLNRDLSRPQHILQLRDIKPKDSHAQRKGHSRKEVPILSLLVEQWRVLEDAESSRADGEEIKPLHDDQINEVDGTSFVEARGGVVGVDVAGEIAVLEPEGREGDAASLEVPVRHGEGGNCLKDANEAVGL